jgi:hypothetical protein
LAVRTGCSARRGPDIDYHSYAQLVLYPVGWQVETYGGDTPRTAVPAGDDQRPAGAGYDPDVGGELYTTNGEITDTMYLEHGILAYTIELDGGSGDPVGGTTSAGNGVGMNPGGIETVADRATRAALVRQGLGHLGVNPYTQTTGTVGGTVPPTLALTLGPAASFGAFLPGVDQTYTANTTANVVSSAGEATLSVTDPGHLANGAFELPEPLQVAFSKSSWDGPVSNDPVDIAFSQHIGERDALRTGTYSRTLTFTLSTATP